MAEGNLAQQEVAQCIRAENFLDGFGAHDVPFRFGHFALVEEQPAIRLHRARQRNARSHQKRRPVNAMETADLLADKMQIGRPELCESRLVFWIIGAIAQRGNVVDQRVKPYVDHVLLVAGNRDSPGKTRAAHRQILEAPAHKRDHLSPRGLRPHEIRIGLVKLQQLALEGRELEEIIFLAHRLRHSAAVGANRSRRPVHIKLIAHAILAGIGAFVDETLVAQRGKQLLRPALVALFGGTNEVVVAQPQLVPQPAKLARNRRGKLRGRAVRQSSRPLDLLPVLVRASEKPGFDAQSALAPRNGVADDGRVGVAQVRPRIHVVNGRGQIKACRT